MIAKALTIAGSDSGGGAGIQADLKTFAALGAYGSSVIVALTAQNTRCVKSVMAATPEFVADQIDQVMEDIGADAAKTGMLLNAEIIHIVAHRVKKHAIAPLVVDPVMVAKSGDRLLQESAIEALRESLMPLATLVTPNLGEAEVLAGFPVRDKDAMQEAAQAIKALGAQWVLVKGGHLTDSADDLLYDGTQMTWFPGKRIDTPHTHGTGCTYSAAITAYLAQGLPMPEAVLRAKEYLTGALKAAFVVGSGHNPVHHFYRVWSPS
ncbi:MAG: bifunctional hydroxymethylpyrimidine kinase/phosphomethylpyrimidine kinase [Fimbriimonadia bacterium]|nr:bifunctional hydroxymethylpyrimidine kinase/phosphomethylpyrimidine kinase [Fimbriimonadia bacterium]